MARRETTKYRMCVYRESFDLNVRLKEKDSALNEICPCWQHHAISSCRCCHLKQLLVLQPQSKSKRMNIITRINNAAVMALAAVVIVAVFFHHDIQVEAFAIINHHQKNHHWGIIQQQCSTSTTGNSCNHQLIQQLQSQQRKRFYDEQNEYVLFSRRATTTRLFASSKSSSSSSSPLPLQPVPADQEGIPIPFVDVTNQSYIECYADSIAIIDNIEYTIGVPCDYSVALCYFDKNQQLIPIELDDPIMDDIYSVAESIVEEEFGDELVLQRTPQTLTLVGELEDDDEDDEEDFLLDGDSDDDMDDNADGDEEVEVLLTFEHEGREYNLVRLLDPILLVGKQDEKQPLNRVLLSPEESDQVMPALEDMFLEFRADRDEMLP